MGSFRIFGEIVHERAVLGGCFVEGKGVISFGLRMDARLWPTEGQNRMVLLGAYICIPLGLPI